MDEKTPKQSPLPKSVPTPQTDSIHPDTAFKGYSLADIRYYRALTALQREFCAQKIVADVHRIQKGNPITGDGSAVKGKASRLGPLAGRIMSGLNYMDYALLGFQAFSTVRKVFSFFRRKK
ncbi:MAG: hypothetical protein K2O24_05715 [Muribaculaceae bacterium]|nr:hypothetical protein [Muribaculaceae bacterium]